MKRIVCIWVSAMMLALVLITLGAAQSQPLGDYARAARKDKKTGAAAKQFDNDNLPKSDKLSIVGQAPATETKDGDGNSDVASNVNSSTDSNSGTDKPKDSAAEAAQKSADAQAEKQKLWDEWQKKIADQKEKVDSQAHELDLLQREYKLRAAAMYGDVGNRLRNSAAWDKEDAQYKQQIADKHKAVDAAKQQLDDMQEQARKAGVPSSKRE
jgi:hypothetical protein